MKEIKNYPAAKAHETLNRTTEELKVEALHEVQGLGGPLNRTTEELKVKASGQSRRAILPLNRTTEELKDDGDFYTGQINTSP